MMAAAALAAVAAALAAVAAALAALLMALPDGADCQGCHGHKGRDHDEVSYHGRYHRHALLS